MYGGGIAIWWPGMHMHQCSWSVMQHTFTFSGIQDNTSKVMDAKLVAAWLGLDKQLVLAMRVNQLMKKCLISSLKKFNNTLVHDSQPNPTKKP